VYGIRNVVDVWQAARAVVQEPGLRGAIGSILPEGFGLVRSIFFDKPPGRTWSLPWHRDLTIAVRDTSDAPGEFRRPTVKAGVPHIEAPTWLLGDMLTARVALDGVLEENGPLLVIPGSHRDVGAERLPGDEELATRAHAIHVRAGDVLLIRPLVVHRSRASRTGTRRHRRTLHFEFAPEQSLPGSLAWHRFLGITP
jgi:ectoine hydroxylase-related dioxygenase (phytanoyl-CoA dioxygenase family)